MKTYLFTFALSFSSFAYGESCLTNLMQVESASCHDVKKLALPLLEKEKQKHDAIAKDIISQSFRFKMDEILSRFSQMDNILSYSNVEADGRDIKGCSLDDIKNELTCSQNIDKTYIEALTGGQFSSLDSLFGGIKKNYENKVEKSIFPRSNGCFTLSFMKESYLDELFIKYPNVSTEELLNLENTQDNELKSLREELENIFPNLKDIVTSISANVVRGSSTKERFQSIIKLSRNSLSKGLGETCRDFKKTVDALVCNPVTDFVSNKDSLNRERFNYPSDLLINGFDSFEIEMEGLDVDEVFKGYVLNCPQIRPVESIVDSSENKNNGDLNLDDFFDTIGISYDELSSAGSSEFNFNQKLEEKYGNYCPYLSCANPNEVSEGAACEPLKEVRSMAQINEVLNCPGDEFCRDSGLQSLMQALGRQEKRELDQMVSGGSSASARSVFTRQFLGEEATAPVNPNSTAEAKPVEPLASPRVDDEGKVVVANHSNIDEIMESESKQAPSTSSQVQNQIQSTASNRSAAPISAPVSAPLGQTDSDADSAEQRRSDLMTQRKALEEMMEKMTSAQKSQGNASSAQAYDTSLQDIAGANKGIERRYNSYGRDDKYDWPYGYDETPNAIGNSDAFDATDLSSLRSGLENINPITPTDAPYAFIPPEKPSDRPTDEAQGEAVASAEGTPGSAKQEGALSGGRGPASVGSSSSGSVAGINELLDQINELSEDLKIETTPQNLEKLSLDDLKRQGVGVDEPFVMIIKDQGAEISLPVRPVTFKGEKLLAPVLDERNVRVVSYLRRSPLFKRYYDYQRYQ